MNDLGTINLLVDVQGRPMVTGLANDLNQVVVAEQKVSNATKEVINNFRSLRAMQDMAKRSTDDLSNSFTRLSAQDLNRASNALAGYETALANSRRGMGSMGVVIQQTGYQVGDFLVQIQSGTNFMVALGQQATQLVGILPMMTGFMGLSTGALVGLSAGLGIAIPLVTALAAAFMRTSEESNKSAEELKKFEQVLETISQKSSDTALNLEALTRGIAPDEILSSRLAIQSLIETLDVLRTTEVEGFLDTFTRSDRIVAAQNLKVALEDALETLIQQTEYEQRLEAAARRRANEQRNAYREATSAADRLYAQLLSIADLDLSSAFTSAIGPLNALLQGASALYTRMAAVAYLKSNASGGASYLANQYSLYGQGRVAGEQAAREAGSLYTPFPVPEVSDGGGGGGRAEARLKKQIDLTKELTQVERERQTVIRSVEGSLEDGFMAMVEGTESVKDAFKKMAYEVIKELYRVLVVQRLVGGISNSISLFGGPSTGSFGLPFGGANASGGSVMPGKSYLVGENGPELVIPRHSGTVVNANQTASADGGNGGFTQNLTISVTGSDSAMVRAEVAKMIPQITNATKAAVIDARLRGGQMKAAFS